jgi:hypothetical protein
MWQFSKPILWANLIARLVSAFLVHGWFDGSADHIDLSQLTFVVAGVLPSVTARISRRARQTGRSAAGE